MMKKLLFSIFLLCVICSVHAQNTLVKIALKSGVIITGVLKELNSAEYAVVNVAGVDTKILMENVSSIESIISDSSLAKNNKADEVFDKEQIGNYKITDYAEYPESLKLVINGHEMVMILVRGGTFNMGYDGRGSLRMRSEPIHQVNLSSFYISLNCLNDKSALYLLGKVKKSHDGSYYNFTWKDAKQAVDKLAEETQMPYRMLTEAEWEYASLMPNAEKIFGLAKYIEWCSDYFGKYLSSFQTNPQGPDRGKEHVYRSFRPEKNKWDRRVEPITLGKAFVRIAISADIVKSIYNE